MKRMFLILSVLILLLIVISSCGRNSDAIRTFPLDSLDGVIAHDDFISLDKYISADGKGSIRVDVHGPITVPLFDLADLKIDNLRLTYTAKVRTERLIGQVFLEMICYFPVRGEVISRGQETLLAGTNDWKEQRIYLDFHKGDLPDSVKLNLAVNGRGTVWIDDIKLLRAPLRSTVK